MRQSPLFSLCFFSPQLRKCFNPSSLHVDVSQYLLLTFLAIRFRPRKTQKIQSTRVMHFYQPSNNKQHKYTIKNKNENTGEERWKNMEACLIHVRNLTASDAIWISRDVTRARFSCNCNNGIEKKNENILYSQMWISCLLK